MVHRLKGGGEIIFNMAQISFDTTGTQNLLRENLSLKKYSNVITYENAQLKETLRRQKGYWAADTATLAPAAITESAELPANAIKGP